MGMQGKDSICACWGTLTVQKCLNSIMDQRQCPHLLHRDRHGHDNLGERPRFASTAVFVYKRSSHHCAADQQVSINLLV